MNNKQLSPKFYLTKVDERLLGQEVYLLKEEDVIDIVNKLKALEFLKNIIRIRCSYNSYSPHIVKIEISGEANVLKDEFYPLKEVLK